MDEEGSFQDEVRSAWSFEVWRTLDRGTVRRRSLHPPDRRAEIRAELNANPEGVDFYGAYAEARALVASIPGIPVTYLFGAQQVLPPEWKEGAYEAALHRFLDGLPDGRLIELAADHDLPLDEPEAIADAVRQTLSASG